MAANGLAFQTLKNPRETGIYTQVHRRRWKNQTNTSQQNCCGFRWGCLLQITLLKCLIAPYFPLLTVLTFSRGAWNGPKPAPIQNLRFPLEVSGVKPVAIRQKYIKYRQSQHNNYLVWGENNIKQLILCLYRSMSRLPCYCHCFLLCCLLDAYCYWLSAMENEKSITSQGKHFGQVQR